MNDNPLTCQQTAEYAMALDLCVELTRVTDETQVIDRIIGIVLSLFAPDKIVFWVMDTGVVLHARTYPETTDPGIPPDPQGNLPVLFERGFRLRIPFKDTTLGIIEIDGLAYPGHRDRYLSLGLAIAGVCGLALSNARAHSRLETTLEALRSEYEKTSHLGDQLQAANRDLEDRVQQRTSELESALAHLREENRQRISAEEIIRNQLDEKTFLLRELHHRVKNNLQLITSILGMQSRITTDPALRASLSEMKNRIRSIAVVHEKLWKAKDLSHINLQDIVRQIPPEMYEMYHVPPESVALSIDAAPVVVDINTAIPLALVLNELFSNALKHAFPQGRRGEITLMISDDTSDGILIHFSDNGVGMPEGFDWQNAGSTGFVIINSEVQQLQGTIRREAGPGTIFSIRVPYLQRDLHSLRGTYNKV